MVIIKVSIYTVVHLYSYTLCECYLERVWFCNIGYSEINIAIVPGGKSLRGKSLALAIHYRPERGRHWQLCSYIVSAENHVSTLWFILRVSDLNSCVYSLMSSLYIYGFITSTRHTSWQDVFSESCLPDYKVPSSLVSVSGKVRWLCIQRALLMLLNISRFIHIYLKKYSIFGDYQRLALM